MGPCPHTEIMGKNMYCAKEQNIIPSVKPHVLKSSF